LEGADLVLPVLALGFDDVLEVYEAQQELLKGRALVFELI
jgi:hypothetical protein